MNNTNIVFQSNDLDLISVPLSEIEGSLIYGVHKTALLLANELQVPLSDITIRFMDGE